MKNMSVKLKITLWITVLMAALFVLLLLFMLGISRQVVYQTAMQNLSDTVQNNVSEVTLTDGKLQLGEGFVYYHSGISVLVYSQNETLLAGQVPVTFVAQEPFESGRTRAVLSGNESYLVMDLWVPAGWDSGVWLRGVVEAPDYRSTVRNLLYVALFALPIFILLTAIGGWMIVKRTFHPLDTITKTASTINEARDLSGRIGLPPGKDEFSRLAAAFDGMFERLEASFEAERQFTADASHELRTPVSIIKGACEYAEKYDETEEERKETLDMIHRQADKMSSMIAQLLRMTRLEQGTEVTRMEKTDLAQLARSVCAEQGYDAEHVRLEADKPVIVRVDAALLSRLLQNLVSNAIKYGKPDGHVWISVRCTAGEALLSVRDDGIGIAPEQQEKIWQRFYQVDASRGDESGAGLGLSMVQQIAQIHGGRMTLESILGVGSDFTLHLPLAEM